MGAAFGRFREVGVGTFTVLGLRALAGMVVNCVTSIITRERTAASCAGLFGAALGTVAGVYTGLVELLFVPLEDAALGECIARRDALRTGKAGLATWRGRAAGAAINLA